MTTKGFGYMLRTHGLIAECGTMNLIIGHTEADAVPPGADGERGRQCRKWLDEWAALGKMVVAVTAYAAVDDDDDGFAEAGIPAVITDGKVGLTAADADKLIELLGRAG